jgi:hypothetical protein
LIIVALNGLENIKLKDVKDFNVNIEDKNIKNDFLS